MYYTEDNTDIGNGTDAGGNFDTALPITVGFYPKSWLIAGTAGNDEKDFYSISLKKGEQISVKLTPESDALLGLVIYDGDRVQQSYKKCPNKGAIISVDYLSPKDQTVYIGALRDFYGAAGGFYSLNITSLNITSSQVNLICTSGEKKCSGKDILVCNGTAWNINKTCSYKCSNGACISAP